MALLRATVDHAQKTCGHTAEQDRPDVLKPDREWFESQLDHDRHHLVFINETGASTKMARLHGRTPHRQRLRARYPNATTFWK